MWPELQSVAGEINTKLLSGCKPLLSKNTPPTEPLFPTSPDDTNISSQLPREFAPWVEVWGLLVVASKCSSRDTALKFSFKDKKKIIRMNSVQLFYSNVVLSSWSAYWRHAGNLSKEAQIAAQCLEVRLRMLGNRGKMEKKKRTGKAALHSS